MIKHLVRIIVAIFIFCLSLLAQYGIFAVCAAQQNETSRVTIIPDQESVVIERKTGEEGYHVSYIDSIGFMFSEIGQEYKYCDYTHYEETFPGWLKGWLGIAFDKVVYAVKPLRHIIFPISGANEMSRYFDDDRMVGNQYYVEGYGYNLNGLGIPNDTEIVKFKDGNGNSYTTSFLYTPQDSNESEFPYKVYAVELEDYVTVRCDTYLNILDSYRIYNKYNNGSMDRYYSVVVKNDAVKSELTMAYYQILVSIIFTLIIMIELPIVESNKNRDINPGDPAGATVIDSQTFAISRMFNNKKSRKEKRLARREKKLAKKAKKLAKKQK